MLLQELVEQDMIANGFDPRKMSNIITYWAERLPL